MTASDLLAALQERGAELRADGDLLRLRVPRGVLTEEDRAALQAHKPELLALLARPADAPPPAPEPDSESEPVAAYELPDCVGVPAGAQSGAGPPMSGAGARKVDLNACLLEANGQFRHTWRPTGACGYCSGTAWCLWLTPRHGGAWLWACAACADRLGAHPPASIAAAQADPLPPLPLPVDPSPPRDADAPASKGGRP